MHNINLLEEKYLKAKIAYYEGSPILSDLEFDTIEQILKENGSKVIEQVGSKRKDFDFTHPTKMLSLAKVQMETMPDGQTNYMKAEFEDWYHKRLLQIGILVDLSASPKLDGNAINIIYRGNKLSNVLTRGDGFTGKDISKRFVNKIPQTLQLTNLNISDTDVIEIRCEVVINTKLFNEKYAKDFSNPRNYVAGVIGKDDEDQLKISELSIMPLHFLVNGNHEDQSKFDIPFYSNNINKVFKYTDYIDVIKSFEKLRETYEFQLDGIVITFPYQYRALLGENSHDPEWGIAIKYVPDEVVTQYEGIEWSVSKRGEIIPVILLSPVQLSGTIVKRASGYNAGYIVDNKIGIGSYMSIAKAGEIIPEVQRVVVESEEDPNNLLISSCPGCNAPLEFDGIHLMCTNNKCYGKIAKQLSSALKVLEIQRIGEKTIEPFANDFSNMFDVIKWALTIGESSNDIEKYGIKFGGRSHEIFIQAFKNIKSLSYAQVIQMLGYENVGDKISIQLAREHAGLDFDYANLERALVSKLRSEEVSNYIKMVVTELENLGIVIDKPKKSNNTNNIYVCMTGSPKDFGFKTKEEFISNFPSVEEVSLTDKRCQYLITDSYTSSSNKMSTATKKGITIKTYGDFKII